MAQEIADKAKTEWKDTLAAYKEILGYHVQCTEYAAGSDENLDCLGKYPKSAVVAAEECSTSKEKEYNNRLDEYNKLF